MKVGADQPQNKYFQLQALGFIYLVKIFIGTAPKLDHQSPMLTDGFDLPPLWFVLTSWRASGG